MLKHTLSPKFMNITSFGVSLSSSLSDNVSHPIPIIMMKIRKCLHNEDYGVFKVYIWVHFWERFIYICVSLWVCGSSSLSQFSVFNFYSSKKLLVKDEIIMLKTFWLFIFVCSTSPIPPLCTFSMQYQFWNIFSFFSTLKYHYLD